MFIVPPAPSPVRLVCSDGRVWEYPSLGELANERGWWWLNEHVGTHFRVLDPTYRACGFEKPYHIHRSYVVRRDDGEPYTLEECLAACRRDPPGYLYTFAWRYPWWRGVGAVPGTAKRKAGGHSFRYPKTLAALRAACSPEKTEGEPLFRGKRRKGRVPTAYDDRQISNLSIRSWKRHRGAQWAARCDRSFATSRDSLRSLEVVER